MNQQNLLSQSLFSEEQISSEKYQKPRHCCSPGISELLFFEKQKMDSNKQCFQEEKNNDLFSYNVYQDSQPIDLHEQLDLECTMPLKNSALDMHPNENESHLRLNLTPPIKSPPVIYYDHFERRPQLPKCCRRKLSIQNDEENRGMDFANSGKKKLRQHGKTMCRVSKLCRGKVIGLESKRQRKLSIFSFDKQDNNKNSIFSDFKKTFKLNDGPFNLKLKKSEIKENKQINFIQDVKIETLNDFNQRVRNHEKSIFKNITDKSIIHFDKMENKNEFFKNFTKDHVKKNNSKINILDFRKCKNSNENSKNIVNQYRFIKKNEYDSMKKFDNHEVENFNNRFFAKNKKNAFDPCRNMNNEIRKKLDCQNNFYQKVKKNSKIFQKNKTLNLKNLNPENLNHSTKTALSKETLTDLESHLSPSIQIYMTIMTDFCDAMIHHFKANSLESLDCSTLLLYVRQFIGNHKLNASGFSQAMFENQLRVLESMGKEFRIDDLIFIKKFFSLSQNISSNYDSMENYFVDEQTQCVYYKVKSDDKKTFGVKNSVPSICEKKLISMTEFMSRSDPNSPFKMSLTQSQFTQSPAFNKLSPSFNTPIPTSSSKNLEKLLLNSSRKFKSKNYKHPGIKKRIYKKSACKGCKCSKSKCLRLHCVCFRDGKFCGDSCNCQGCFNTLEHKGLVENVVKVTKEINSQAFKSRIIKIQVKGQMVELTSGCSCSKNQCLKNYCECRKNGLPCSPLCKCENCKNCKLDLDPQVASSLYQKASRKKKKIIFKNTAKDKIVVSEQILAKRFRR